MEETLKGIQIESKALARRSNVMWDILSTCEEEARKHWRTKSVRLQTVHGYPEDQVDVTLGAHGPYGGATGGLFFPDLVR